MSDRIDVANEQAACVVAALDRYLALFPWPEPTYETHAAIKVSMRDDARTFLIRTIAGMIRMSEPRKSDLQRGSIVTVSTENLRSGTGWVSAAPSHKEE
jgi:hypothetical protein